MGNWVNFAEIRAKVSLEAVLLELYGLKNLKREGDKLIGPCPIHNGDSPRAFHADLAKNVWHCFSRCQKGGNHIDFVAMKEGLSIREAALKLQEHFLGGGTSGPRAGPVPERTPPVTPAKEPTSPKPAEPEKNPVIDIELRLRPDHPHLVDVRKLAAQTSAHFGIGFCSHGTLRGTIAIPIHNDEGGLVAYAGRRLKPEDIRTHGKYKLPKGFKKDLVLYNLHRARGPGLEKGLVLVEGFFSVLALHEAGFENVVASMGCELSAHQAMLLTAFPEVVILYDGDGPGTLGASAAREKLAGKTIVRLITLPAGTKPDELSPRALKWLINGVQLLDLEHVTYTPRAPRG